MRYLTKYQINKKIKILKLLKLKYLVTILPRVYRKKRFWVRNIYKTRSNFGDFHALMAELRVKNTNEESNEKFNNYFRMTPTDFDELLSTVQHLITKISCTREVIPPGEKLAITLRYLASGDSMNSIAYSFRVGNATASNIIRETIAALWTVLSPHVFPKYSKDMWVDVAENFYNITNFPNCLGALDGKHVQVQEFNKTGSANFNYKGSHSIVLMAMCDAQYRFTMVDIGAAGRHSDGGIFKNCEFGKAFLKSNVDVPMDAVLKNSTNNIHTPYVVIADEAFPLLKNMMRPFPGRNSIHRMDIDKEVFNFRLSRARRIIENSFGILRARWRIFRGPISAGYDTVVNITKATCALHNWLINRNGSYISPGSVDTFTNEGNLIIRGRWRTETVNDTNMLPLSNRNCNAPTKSGIEVRNIFKNYFMGDGMVPWQFQNLHNITSD